MNDITEPVVGISERPLRISRLEVRFEVPGIEFKRIYANGRMQTRVWVMVEAVDEETGDSVPLSYYPDLISARLIQYHDGQPLRSGGYNGQPMPGWTASYEKNRYTQQMPGATHIPHSRGGSTGIVREFWVSSSEVDKLQIAAEITVQGNVYKSNNTVNPDGSRINKSVVVVAERTPAYSLDHFTWVPHQIEGAFNGAMVFRYCLGLYLAGQQIKLLEWDTKQYEGSGKYPIKFCYTGLILGRQVRDP